MRVVLDCRGRVVVSGIGKSGHIARKIASTLASTGTPAFFVHPAEASHGDLGMVTRDDVFIGLSNSGESARAPRDRAAAQAPGREADRAHGQRRSRASRTKPTCICTRARKRKRVRSTSRRPRARPRRSRWATRSRSRSCTRKASRGTSSRAPIPGGALGRKLLTHVRDVMRTGDDAPRVGRDATLMDAMLEMSRGRMGMTAVARRQRARDRHLHRRRPAAHARAKASICARHASATSWAARRAPSRPNASPPKRSRSWSATR